MSLQNRWMVVHLTVVTKEWVGGFSRVRWILTADVFLFPFDCHGCEYNTGCEMAALTVAVKRRRIEISCCAAAAEDLAAAALISGPGARVLAFVCSRIL